MNKEFINEMASMFSLMERMDKHATLNEAIGNKRYYLSESTNGQLEPAVRFIKDDSQQLGDSMVIKGLFREDADNMVNAFGMGDVSSIKPSANGDSNKDIVEIKFDNLGSPSEISQILSDYIIPMLQQGQTNNTYNLSTLNDSVTNGANYYYSTVPDSVKSGFAGMQSSAITSAIENLDMENIPDIKAYLVSMVTNGKVDPSKLQAQVQQIVRAEITEIGSQLSPKNILVIEYQARHKYGLQPGDPEWPTFVASPKSWKDLGRKIKDGAKHPYAYESPSELLSKHQAMEKYNREHPNAMVNSFAEFQKLPGQTKMRYRHVDDNSITNYEVTYGYDITDTEDTSGFDKFFNETGLINNLTGELNSVAQMAQNNQQNPDPNGAPAQNPQQQPAQGGSSTPSVQRFLAKEGVSRLADQVGVPTVDTGDIDKDVTDMVVGICEKLGHDTYNIIHKNDMYAYYLASLYVIGSLKCIDKSYILDRVRREQVNYSNVGEKAGGKLSGTIEALGKAVRSQIKKNGNEVASQQAQAQSQGSQVKPVAESLIREGIEFNEISFEEIAQKYL